MPVVPCPTPCPPVVLGIVVFDPAEFTAIWPEFAGLHNVQMQNAFNLATLLLSNSCGSLIQDANLRLSLLYMLTAHVAFLIYGTNDGAGIINPPPGIVGRIAQAAEGSVSVAAEYSSEVGQSMAFYIQSKYGAMFWEATSVYRTARYIPAPQCGPNGPGFPFGDFGWPEFG